MDRKSIIALVVCFIVLLLWYPLVVNKLYPPKPLPQGQTNHLSGAVLSDTNEPSKPGAPISATETPQTITRSAENPAVPEDLIDVTNENARYTFTSRGGGLKLIELLRYPESVSSRREKQPFTNRVAALNVETPDPTLALLDGEAVQGDGIFKLSRIERGVRAEKTLTNGLTIVKEFRLSTNYLVNATVRLENHSSQPLTLPAQEWVVGTATPMNPRDNGLAVGVVWYNGTKTEDVLGPYFSTNTSTLFVIPRTPKTEYRGGASNVFWAATHNQFFALAAMPAAPAQSIVIRRVELPKLTGEEASLVATNAPPPQGYEAAMVFPGITLPPNGNVERLVFIYAGPKEYQTLARIGYTFSNNLDLLMNFGWVGFVSKALLLGMNWLHHGMRVPYGWAIIVITVLIKLIFWPLTQASTRSMKRMQALQPQMNAIKEKYKDDPVKAQRKTMELWKEHKVSPIGGCLPMVLQIPVFFGFYRMIQSAIELRGAPFLWVGDLSKSDTLFVIPGLGFVPIIGIAGVGLPFNLLPLIMGATMLWQARLTPPSPGMDPTQAKIMRYMPLMFMVILYNFSAGLTLYWTVQNLLTIAQTKLTRTTTSPAPALQAPVLTAPQKKRK
jgi:YidC/Oxa1 family membrane protein insertase